MPFTYKNYKCKVCGEVHRGWIHSECFLLGICVACYKKGIEEGKVYVTYDCRVCDVPVATTQNSQMHKMRMCAFHLEEQGKLTIIRG